MQAGQAAAGAVRQVAAGTSAGLDTAGAQLQETLQEGLEVAREAVDTVAGVGTQRCLCVRARRVAVVGGLLLGRGVDGEVSG